jgi:Glycosyltransferase family 87
VNILKNHHAVCWTERAVLCLTLLYLCIHTIPRAWAELNTDFPNYYMAARLAHEGYDTSRMYEWSWIEREKDHRAVDIRVIGLLPLTPFSTLAMWPLTGFKPLAAKHVWILLSLAFLVPIAWMLRSMAGLSYQRVALVFSLNFPLHRNLMFGQFYVFLLLLIVMACWAHLRGLRALAGALVAVAAACKVFPVLLFIFFLRRRDWRALAWGATTGLAAAAASIGVFGWNVHRTWLHEILPWTLRGEGLQPYTKSASISGVLHCLFLSEPQWNPHPWHNSSLCYSLLAPLLQVLTLAPAVLLIRKEDNSRGRTLLEWSALLTAALAISTIPASYNFVLMALPVCVLTAALLEQKRYGWLATLMIAYLGIGYPLPVPQKIAGLALLLYVPRLPLMLALLIGIYALLWNDRAATGASHDWTRYMWAAAMVASAILSVRSTLRLELAMRQEYAYRLPLSIQGYLNSAPQSAGTKVRYAAFTLDGYHLVTQDDKGNWSDSSADSAYDDLSFTSGFGHVWVERALSPHSQIVDVQEPSRTVIDNARDPMLSADRESLAFVRDNLGKGRLMVRKTLQTNPADEVMLTPSSLNVYEASFLSEKEYAFSAVANGHPPQLYLTDASHTNAPLSLGESRFPAISSDERWMAYSRLDRGVWNLWLRDQRNGTTSRIADVPCNQVQPSWESDSKTLLYSTDCGRSVWFTAVARRKVVP